MKKVEGVTKLYLSGPMTGYTDFNFPAFAQAKKNLVKAGNAVLSAHEIKHKDGGVPGSLSHSEYLRGDLIEMLRKCDGIVLLPGFEKSKGAQLELHVARELGWRCFKYMPLHPGWTMFEYVSRPR